MAVAGTPDEAAVVVMATGSFEVAVPGAPGEIDVGFVLAAVVVDV